MATNAARNVARLGKNLLPRAEPKSISEHGILFKDPAIERWSYVKENTTRYFKWTGKTVSLGLFWCIVIPGSILYALKKDLEYQSERDGKPLPKYFPFTFEVNERKIDPLPPRKPGVKVPEDFL